MAEQEKSGAFPGSAANVTQFLKNIDFPSRKDDIVKHAQQNGADEEVLKALRNLPDTEYTNMADVMKGFGEARS